MVSVDAKHHVYLLSGLTVRGVGGRGFEPSYIVDVSKDRAAVRSAEYDDDDDVGLHILGHGVDILGTNCKGRLNFHL